MAEGDLLWQIGVGAVAVGSVYFVATHPALMGEWVLWAAWQLRALELAALVALTFWLLLRRRRARKQQKLALDNLRAALGNQTAAPAAPNTAVPEHAVPPVQRVEHIHIHLNADDLPHPYKCHCQGKARLSCSLPGDHAKHAGCDPAPDGPTVPCPFDLAETEA